MGKRPIYYDTETTGVKPEKDRIIELAAYDAERDQSFQALINPECLIPEEATAIHHITNEMVQDAPLFEDVAKQFLDFCSGDIVLIAHNNDAFDKPFISYEFKRANLSLPSWSYIDTLKWSRKYRPDLPKHSLQHLREYHGIPANQAHRALDDVIILHRVFSEMIDDLNIETVLELMNAPQVIRHMPFGKHRGEPLKKVPRSYVAWLKENGALDKPDNLDLKKSFEHFGLI